MKRGGPLKRTGGLKGGGELKRTPMHRGNGFAKQGASMPNGNYKLKARSDKRKSVEDDYKALCSTLPNRCCSCGTDRYLSNSHLIPRSKGEKYVAMRLNVVRQCMTMGDRIGCHEKWESHRLRQTLPNYDELMSRVEKMDPKHHEYLKMKEREING